MVQRVSIQIYWWCNNSFIKNELSLDDQRRIEGSGQINYISIPYKLPIWRCSNNMLQISGPLNKCYFECSKNAMRNYNAAKIWYKLQHAISKMLFVTHSRTPSLTRHLIYYTSCHRASCAILAILLMIAYTSEERKRNYKLYINWLLLHL